MSQSEAVKENNSSNVSIDICNDVFSNQKGKFRFQIGLKC